MKKLYSKEINGELNISRCRHLQLNDGRTILNPTEEQIYAEGWIDYDSPKKSVFIYKPSMQERFNALTRLIGIDNTLSSMGDKDALETAVLFPHFGDNIGKQASVGERYYYNNKLYKVLTPHIISTQWTPDVAPSLWVEVSIEECPEWVQPVGSTDAYNIGAKVSHNGKHWQSLVDGNVWEPSEAVPTLWQLVA